MDATIAVRARGTRVLSLICGGHFVSHFYMMVLPPLFPFISGDLGLSYAELGFLLTARFVATGLAQVPAGFLVDRYGAKLVLVGGMMLMVLGYILFTFGGGFWPLLLFACLGGAGDAVFHPADYAILNGSMAQDRMGRAYSFHTFAGHIGFAVGPATMPFLAVAFGWRAAMLAAALFGFAIMVAILSQWNTLREEDGAKPSKKDKGDSAARGVSILLNPSILLLFGFFTISTLASNGITGFSVSALIKLQDVPEELAGTPLSAFMLASAFAVLAGGIVADRKIRQDLFAAFGFLMAALIILLIAAVPMPYVGLLGAFATAGFFLGVIRPARDLMVRDLAPPGASGKVFGFVFSGQTVGGAIAPPIYGYLVDIGNPSTVFLVSAGFLFLGILTVIGGRKLIVN